MLNLLDLWSSILTHSHGLIYTVCKLRWPHQGYSYVAWTVESIHFSMIRHSIHKTVVKPLQVTLNTQNTYKIFAYCTKTWNWRILVTALGPPWLNFTRSPCECNGFLWVHWFPPTSQKHGRWMFVCTVHCDGHPLYIPASHPV